MTKDDEGRRRATKGGLSFSRVLFDVHVRAAVEKPNEQRIFVHERAGAVMEDVVLCFPRKRGRVRYQTRCWGRGFCNGTQLSTEPHACPMRSCSSCAWQPPKAADPQNARRDSVSKPSDPYCNRCLSFDFPARECCEALGWYGIPKRRLPRAPATGLDPRRLVITALAHARDCAGCACMPAIGLPVLCRKTKLPAHVSYDDPLIVGGVSIIWNHVTMP